MSKDLIPTLIVPDCHIPFEDARAWDLMMKVATDFGPELITIIGDFADFYAISDHLRDPKRATELETEVEAANLRLNELDELGAKDKIYIAGNHEDRLTRYLQRTAPELHGITSIPKMFKLKERGWQYVAYRKHTKRGKLYFTHDVGVAGRYSVYRCLEAFEHSVVTGHSHRLAYVVEGNVTGTRKLSAQFGWLGDISQIDYMAEVKAIKDWALGFGIGYIHRQTGIAYLTPLPIVNYTCCFEGRIYTS